MADDERRLVKRFLAGDRTAFDPLYDRNAPRIYNLLRRMTGNDQIAEDLTQETFVAASRNIAGWRGSGQLSTWLCGIACRLLANHRRSSRGDGPLTEDIPSNAFQTDPALRCARADLSAQLDGAISGLPDNCRDAFVLVKVE